jgi:uncharacterized protein YdaU (DUF1376 family)
VEAGVSDPWYRRFPDNFLGGTNGLTLEEKGAYGVVIDMIYQRGGPIADEPRYIAGVCNCSVRKWNAIRARLLALDKLYVIDGHLMNERAGKELERAAKIARELAENGAKGGDKSAENRAAAKKAKDLGQAPLKLSRAPPTSTPFKKEGAIASDPTEGTVTLDRWLGHQGALFEVCEEITGKKLPDYVQKHPWPRDIVAQAQAKLAVH